MHRNKTLKAASLNDAVTHDEKSKAQRTHQHRHGYSDQAVQRPWQLVQNVEKFGDAGYVSF